MNYINYVLFASLSKGNTVCTITCDWYMRFYYSNNCLDFVSKILLNESLSHLYNKFYDCNFYPFFFSWKKPNLFVPFFFLLLFYQIYWLSVGSYRMFVYAR